MPDDTTTDVTSAPETGADEAAPTASKKTAKKAAKKTIAKKTTGKKAAQKATAAGADASGASAGGPPAADLAAAAGDVPAPARRTRKRSTAPSAEPEPAEGRDAPEGGAAPAAGLLFQAPDIAAAPPRRRKKAAAGPDGDGEQSGSADATASADVASDPGESTGGAEEESEGGSRRRRRGGRNRRGRSKSDTSDDAKDDTSDETDGGESSGDESEDDGEGGTRRRRRRRRRGSGDDPTAEDDPPNTVTRVREPRSRGKGRGGEDDDGVRSVKGSTRLEAKKQRRREGREAGRRRPSIITEAEFLARRESVRRSMIVRQNAELTQIAVLEDDVLVEHYVAGKNSSGMVGNVYLGKVQNVLPSMEAAFVDIGKGRNAVIYAGEVNWDAAGLEGQPKRIEEALKSGDSVLVQVTKDPIGHKGARLTSQVSLAGRYLVYVPSGAMTGISRKLPDTERSRLKSILKKVVPEGAGVIVRTAAEGASEEELSRDVARLTAQWEDIEKKAKKSTAPELLYSEPDLTIRVVRDIFNEDFAELVVSGDTAWDELSPYVSHVAPDLVDRVSKWGGGDGGDADVFETHRVDEQLAKALERKVWLPSGGYLVIDRTEAMIVVDVNTGKFTGAGGNLEETVTKNNLEAAEEIVRQLRLRDLGGIIVIDFIDMVLESNRDLVLRRLTECLGRDRTKHQVAEVTSLGLVQMTRKRVGQGLLESFSEPCEHCGGRGYHLRNEPVDSGSGSGSGGNGGGNERRRSRGERGGSPKPAPPPAGRPKPAPPANGPAEQTESAPAEATEAESTEPAEPAEPAEQPVPDADETELPDPVAVEDPVAPVDAEDVTGAGADTGSGTDAGDSPAAAGDEPGEMSAETPAPRGRRRRRAVG